MPKYFTFEEANNFIPQLSTMMEGVRDCRRRIAAKEQELSQMKGQRVGGNGNYRANEREIRRVQEEINELVGELQQLVSQVHAVGCVVKDMEMGLVDFLTLRDGEEMYLCWRLGEERIGFWHTIEGGYGARQPI
ncbi:MAG: hypothetical protein HW403_389 [Dehalococcoidia bacterium]|nr:hypothetical protein [Dehalococcoidia bacterium]